MHNGKTNIIESIFLCSMGKSFRSKSDCDLIKFEKSSCKVNVDFEKKDRNGTISCKIDRQKTFLVNGVKQNKISDIIGKINCIIFTPDDMSIIKDGPDKRRKFIDMMISSLRPNYIQLLNDYRSVVEQRNNYLKQILNDNKPENMLEIWDEQLSELASKIYEYRLEYTDKIKEKIEKIHDMITNTGEETEIIKMKYISTGDTKEKYLENLHKARKIDIQRGFTSIGIHRDDIIFYINHKLAEKFGSQGQKRTLILSLKLSELQIVSEEIGDSPILLLDDFMSELDEKRRNILLEKIKDYQVIITCTDKIDFVDSKNKKIFLVEKR